MDMVVARVAAIVVVDVIVIVVAQILIQLVFDLLMKTGVCSWPKMASGPTCWCSSCCCRCLKMDRTARFLSCHPWLCFFHQAIPSSLPFSSASFSFKLNPLFTCTPNLRSLLQSPPFLFSPCSCWTHSVLDFQRKLLAEEIAFSGLSEKKLKLGLILLSYAWP